MPVKPIVLQCLSYCSELLKESGVNDALKLSILDMLALLASKIFAPSAEVGADCYQNYDIQFTLRQLYSCHLEVFIISILLSFYRSCFH